MVVYRNIVVVISAQGPRWLHLAGDIETRNGRPSDGKKHALNLPGQFHVLEKFITLRAHSLVQSLFLFYISLDDVHNEHESNKGDQIVRDPHRNAEERWAKQVV